MNPGSVLLQLLGMKTIVVYFENPWLTPGNQSLDQLLERAPRQLLKHDAALVRGRRIFDFHIEYKKFLTFVLPHASNKQNIVVSSLLSDVALIRWRRLLILFLKRRLFENVIHSQGVHA